MAQKVETIDAKVGATGISTQHKRISVSTAASLAALIAGGVPTKLGPNTGEVMYPQAVWFQVETGGGAVYYTVDGSTPSATNGMQLVTAPSQIRLPYPDHLRNTGTVTAANQQIQLFASSATNVQLLFEFV